MDICKSEFAQHSENWRKKLLVLVGNEISPVPLLINFRTIMAFLLVQMLETWTEWKRQYMRVSSVPQEKGVISTPTASLDPLAGVVRSKTKQFQTLSWVAWCCYCKSPKEVFIQADLLEFDLFDAVSHFNVGARAVLLLQALNISLGKYMEEGCRDLDLDSICGAEYRERDERKKRRKV